LEAGSVPPSLNFPQLDFVKPSSGFHPVTWERVNCLLHLRKKPKDNDEPPDSSLFFINEEKKLKNKDELGGLSLFVFCNPRKTNIKVFFLGLQRMMMSRKAHCPLLGFYVFFFL
jgi:hypothetical protein